LAKTSNQRPFLPLGDLEKRDDPKCNVSGISYFGINTAINGMIYQFKNQNALKNGNHESFEHFF
jgi:hypothetical protein